MTAAANINCFFRENQASRLTPADRGFVSSTIRWVNTLPGACRFAQLLDRVARCYLEIAPTSSVARAVSGKFAVVGAVSILPGTAQCVKDALQGTSADALERNSSDHEVRAARKAHRIQKYTETLGDAVSMVATSGSLIMDLIGAAQSKLNATCRKIADVVGIATNTVKIYLLCKNIAAEGQAREGLGDVIDQQEGLRQQMFHTRVCDTLALAQTTTGLIVAAAGLTLAGTGIALLSGTALTGLATASTICAVWRGIYMEKMEHKPIDYTLRMQEYNNQQSA